MFPRNEAPLHIILVVIAAVLFGIGAFAWPAVVDPYRTRLIACGLMFLTASTFF
jgi:hypothetical protein